jgi:hypothetical protein
MTPQTTLAPLLLTLSLLTSTACLAGRPLTVDDANVNDTGAGHVETWVARQSGGNRTWTVAPAYAVADGIELGAAWTRDTTQGISTTAVQAKFRLTPAQRDACNLGAVVGAARSDDGSGTTPYVNALANCNSDAGALHLNLGANRPSGSKTLRTWGLAVEREVGSLTAHAEYFGQEKSAPTLQFGLRTELVKDVQIDGTVGRSSGDTLLSVGLKFQF